MNAEQLVIDREDVHAQAWTQLGGYRGVMQKVLWRDRAGHSYAGLVRLEPGAHVPEHVHNYASHHVWVVDGVCGMGGEALGSGSYCFVPPGARHELIEVGLEGCTVFYLFLETTLEELAG